jgi:hypothetical protein
LAGTFKKTLDFLFCKKGLTMNAMESPKWLDLPVEERRKRVMAEITLNRALNKGEVDLNNFYDLFYPADLVGNIGNLRDRTMEVDEDDVPIGVALASSAGVMKYSEKFRSQTPQQFFDELDKVCAEQSIKREQTDALIRRLDALTPRDSQIGELDKRISIISQLHELLLPVYIELRVQGYNDADLGVD